METNRENTYIELHKKMDKITTKIDVIHVLLTCVEREMQSKQDVERFRQYTSFR